MTDATRNLIGAVVDIVLAVGCVSFLGWMVLSTRRERRKFDERCRLMDATSDRFRRQILSTRSEPDPGDEWKRGV